MSVEHGPTAGEYIVHHLTHLQNKPMAGVIDFSVYNICLLYTSPSPRDLSTSRMPSSA